MQTRQPGAVTAQPPDEAQQQQQLAELVEQVRQAAGSLAETVNRLHNVAELLGGRQKPAEPTPAQKAAATRRERQRVSNDTTEHYQPPALPPLDERKETE